MARGLRSSSKKGNRTKLRSRVFAPVEKARAERLHAKLLETIQQQKPSETAKKAGMDVDKDSTTAAEAAKDDDFPKDMDVDAAATAAKKSSNKDDRKVRKAGRARKPQNSISFPKSRGKGALKPFTGGRVTKRR